MAQILTTEEDRSLLERIQQGDDQAIALLYDRHSTQMYSVAIRLLGDSAPAEEILSDIFLEVWRNPTKFLQRVADLSSAMAIITRNRACALLLNKPPSDTGFVLLSAANRRQQPTTREGALAALDQLAKERRKMLYRAFFNGTTSADPADLARNPLQSDEDIHMSGAAAELADTGLEVLDLKSNAAFAQRRLHVRDAVAHMEGMNRLAHVFVENPDSILQQLVTAAVDLCGADSAGISIEEPEGTDNDFYHWVATAGQYSGFVNAKLPRYPSACGLTLERGRPQILRVTQRFFDLMGIQAPTVTDGILLPWQVDGTRGTIWIMAHGRPEAFDSEDCRMMQALANFAATGVKLQQQQRSLREQAATAAAKAMANNLAHQINNPLQGLMQNVFLFGRGGAESGAFAQQAMGDVVRLSNLVKSLLSFGG